ncbi:hypothetical protein [Streptomyces sp. N35]|uniref:hypothetical protein n=1 Tax=Streptomyces sp. N35 TaxID=2795730 RepID=UPI0018F31BFA|nr:hypothetical protein [Streptomyces sp. N35]
MGRWTVIAQYQYGETYRTEFVRRGLETRSEALEELRAALHSYRPSVRLVEQWRQVYRLADRDSYLVVIKGKVSKWECTLQIAELVSDSTDLSVTESAQWEDRAVAPADGPQDRVPPGF